MQDYMAFVAWALGSRGRRHFSVPADWAVHVTLDHYAATTRKVRAWLDRHSRCTPSPCSWLDAVEGFFAKLTERRLKHAAFHSVVNLQAAINHFVAEHNEWQSPSHNRRSRPDQRRRQKRALSVTFYPLEGRD